MKKDPLNKAHDAQRDATAQHLRSAEAALASQETAMKGLRHTIATVRQELDVVKGRLAVAERLVGAVVVDMEVAR